MKLSKQFMQTNLKWGYLYWQPISLNHPQQGTDGRSAGIACKEKQAGQRHQKPPSFPHACPALWRLQACSCLCLWFHCYFMYLWNRPSIARDKFVQKPFANHLWLPAAWLLTLNLEYFLDWAFWKGAEQEGETAGRCWIRDWRKLQDKHLESLIYLPFFLPPPRFPLGICHSEDKTHTGRQILNWFVPHQLCWCCTNCLNSLRPLWTHETLPGQGFCDI